MAIIPRTGHTVAGAWTQRKRTDSVGTEIRTGELLQASLAGVMAPPGTLPPLENGDRLTRSDFEQRYDAMPHVKKAELIEGIVYMPSPVRVRSHGKPHGQIMSWIGTYSAATPGVDFADNTTLRLDVDNEPQPDAMLWIDAAADGHANVSDDDYLARIFHKKAQTSCKSLIEWKV